MQDFAGHVRRIAENRLSGASELAAEVIEVLRKALSADVPLEALGKALIEAQPSMAPVWNAVGQAITSVSNPAAFDRYALQVKRAPQALARNATSLLGDEPSGPLTVVTISFSATVLLTLQVLATNRSLRVVGADGQPALEGRRLAERLAASGIEVTHYTDAAIGHALEGATAVVVGADAVAPSWFLNKSGTLPLVAAAAHRGVPVYVLATRDKLVSERIGGHLTIREGAPDEVWSTPPTGITVRNPYFERTPLDLVSAVVTDFGVLGAALVADACPTTNDAALLSLGLRL